MLSGVLRVVLIGYIKLQEAILHTRYSLVLSVLRSVSSHLSKSGKAEFCVTEVVCFSFQVHAAV